MVAIRALTVVAVVLLATAGTAPAAGGSVDRSKPVILIHGSDWSAPFGVSCGASFNEMRRRFRDWGHSGPLIRLAYYQHDTDCDHGLGHHGSHGQHHASGHAAGGGHTGGASIRHLGYHLAWYIHDHFSRQGQAVDVIGHSMGPMLIRYALAQVERGHPAFPPRLLVEDVVSLAGPHDGARPIIGTCGNRHCHEMRQGSTFLAWLRQHAWEPDGEGGTDWTAIGAVDDQYVSGVSALAMGACHKVKYLDSSNVDHFDLLHAASRATTADVKRRGCSGDSVVDGSWFWPVRASDKAVATGAW